MNEIMGGSTIRMTDAEVSSSELPDANSLNGKLLDGRYFVLRKIGQGGFGAVYLASDERVMSRRGVVKVLTRRETQNEWSATKFRQEIEALTRIDHPGVVGILDTGELPTGDPYIVMKYVDGVTVRSCMTAQGMNLERVAHLIKQIGSALAEAHENGVLHRDLKPENLMLQTLSGGDEKADHIFVVDELLRPVRTG